MRASHSAPTAAQRRREARRHFQQRAQAEDDAEDAQGNKMLGVDDVANRQNLNWAHERALSNHDDVRNKKEVFPLDTRFTANNKRKHSHPGSSVKVALRIRPHSEQELASDSDRTSWRYTRHQVMAHSEELHGRSYMNSGTVFSFDRVCGPTANNLSVYTRVAQSVVEHVVEGYNGTLIAYGQTGSGKTHSVIGPELQSLVCAKETLSKGAIANAAKLVCDPDHMVAQVDSGILILALTDLFDSLREKELEEPGSSHVVKISHMEIYKEQINDLLMPYKSGMNLRILQEDPVLGVVVQDLTEEQVWNAEEALCLLLMGEAHRHTEVMQHNERSSRSHSIMRVVVYKQAPIFVQEKTDDSDSSESSSESDDDDGDDDDEEEGEEEEEEEEEDIEQKVAQEEKSNVQIEPAVCISCLNIVDLAGSEKQDEYLTVDRNRMSEGAAINRSLLTLREVIHRLTSTSTADTDINEVNNNESVKHTIHATDYNNIDNVSKNNNKNNNNNLTTHSTTTSNSAQTHDEHIPYRESKLTRILKESLGGNASTAVICTVSPSTLCDEETLNTIRFGGMCGLVVNQAVRNEYVWSQTGADIQKRLTDETKRQKELLVQYKLEIDVMRERMDKKESERATAATVFQNQIREQKEEMTETIVAKDEQVVALQHDLVAVRAMQKWWRAQEGRRMQALREDLKIKQEKADRLERELKTLWLQQAQRNGSLVAKSTVVDDTVGGDVVEVHNQNGTNKTNSDMSNGPDGYFLEDKPAAVDLGRLLLLGSHSQLHDNNNSNMDNEDDAYNARNIDVHSQYSSDPDSDCESDGDVSESDVGCRLIDNIAAESDIDANASRQRRSSVTPTQAKRSKKRTASLLSGGRNRRRSSNRTESSHIPASEKAALTRVRSLLQSKVGHDQQMLEETNDAIKMERRKFVAIDVENKSLRMEVEQYRVAQMTLDSHMEILRQERDGAVADNVTSRQLLQQMRNVCEAMKKQIGVLRENETRFEDVEALKEQLERRRQELTDWEESMKGWHERSQQFNAKTEKLAAQVNIDKADLELRVSEVAEEVAKVQREWRRVQKQHEDVSNEAQTVEHERQNLEFIQRQVHDKIQHLQHLQESILGQQQQQQQQQVSSHPPTTSSACPIDVTGFESLERAIEQFTALEQRTRVRQQHIDNREAIATKSVLSARDAVNSMADALRAVLQSTLTANVSGPVSEQNSSRGKTICQAKDRSNGNNLLYAGAQKYFEGILRATHETVSSRKTQVKVQNQARAQVVASLLPGDLVLRVQRQLSSAYVFSRDIVPHAEAARKAAVKRQLRRDGQVPSGVSTRPTSVAVSSCGSPVRVRRNIDTQGTSQASLKHSGASIHYDSSSYWPANEERDGKHVTTPFVTPIKLPKKSVVLGMESEGSGRECVHPIPKLVTIELFD